MFKLCFLHNESEWGESYICPIYKWIGNSEIVRNSKGRDITFVPGGIGFAVKNYSYNKKLIVLFNIYREDGVCEKYILESHYVEKIPGGYEKWQTDKIPLYPYDSPHGRALKLTFSFLIHKDENILISMYEYKYASIDEIYSGHISIDDFRDRYFVVYNNFHVSSLHPAEIQMAWFEANRGWDSLPVRSFFTAGNPDDLSHPRHEIHRLIDMVIERKKSDPWGYHYIHIAVFNFDNPHIAEHLIYAKGTGVEIECIGGWEQVSSLDWHDSIAFMRKEGLPVYGVVRNTPHRRGMASMHAKIIIFDGQAAMTASFNLDFHIWGGNRENAIFHYSPHIALLYENTFQAIKGGIYRAPEINPLARFNSFYSFASYRSTDKKNYRPQDMILREIGHARYSILVVMFDINYLSGYNGYGHIVDCINELIEARYRGVRIKILFNGARVEEGPQPPSWDKDFTRPLREPAKRLVDAGIEVYRLYNQWDIFSPVHHKFAVFDEETVMTGSYNWYTVSTFSDEEMVIIRDRELARTFINEASELMNVCRVKYGHS